MRIEIQRNQIVHVHDATPIVSGGAAVAVRGVDGYSA
jgi:hypothetical protein